MAPSNVRPRQGPRLALFCRIGRSSITICPQKTCRSLLGRLALFFHALSSGRGARSRDPGHASCSFPDIPSSPGLALFCVGCVVLLQRSNAFDLHRAGLTGVSQLSVRLSVPPIVGCILYNISGLPSSEIAARRHFRCGRRSVAHSGRTCRSRRGCQVGVLKGGGTAGIGIWRAPAGRQKGGRELDSGDYKNLC
jgi:hypothetical protein